MKLLVWSGAGRQKHFDTLADYDVVLTTFGTLCRDAELLADFQFYYCILDESQAIKNADTTNAKAVRAVNCQHRIAMTGTPIENSLSDLWSQFEFLNPGLLGKAGTFRKFSARKEVRLEEELQSVAAALQPFMFRRTKEAVATDLPAKTETVLYCEMEGEQQALYDKMAEYYRAELEKQDDSTDASFMLSALMRLRQTACHAGLVNKTHNHIPSAKLNMLMNSLKEIIAEGHKVLIFSQFTSMLGFVKKEVERRSYKYVYLDGKTADRAAVVKEFQEDEECKVFLISLKAGGVGLNLTAASYVFLLDPWWNPAIEAQAVDRAYRIGQKNPVFAYRMVSRGTVEEKILEMQADKRALADSVIGQGQVSEKINGDDMRRLLSF